MYHIYSMIHFTECAHNILSKSVCNKVKVCQYGTDGFGHQIEGMLRMLSSALNNKVEYMYEFRKSYSFEHCNANNDKLTNYLQCALRNLSNIMLNKHKCETEDGINNVLSDDSHYNIVYYENRHFNDIIANDIDYEKNIYFYDGVGCGASLPHYFENKYELEKSLDTLRTAFVENNIYLPEPSYLLNTPDNNTLNIQNISCHIRKGDAVGTRCLDNDRLIDAVRFYQNMPNVRITVHSDGDVDFLRNENTVIMPRETDVLQVFSDFIHADVLIINYSALSIAAHLLAKPDQTVICPNVAGVTFVDRILDKCIRVDNLLGRI